MTRQYPDEAYRCSDIINQHLVNGHAGRWVAIRLSDGGSDGKTYDTRAEAIRFQLHERQCCYVLIPPDGMSPRAAHNFMVLNRQLYDNGMRLSDPEREIHVPQTTIDSLFPKGIPRWKTN